MALLNSREVAAVALLASLWGVLNSIFAPVVFRLFGVPILCDMIGFAALTLAVWWTGRFGAATVVGLVATGINFMFNPGGVHFLGFTAASIIFDVLTVGIGRDRIFRNHVSTTTSILGISVLSAAIAGLIIAVFFMAESALMQWGGILGWAGIHGVGGVIGGLIGISGVSGLVARGFQNGNFGEHMK